VPYDHDPISPEREFSGFRSPTLPPVDNDLQLPKPPGFIRTFLQRNPWLVDAVVMATYFYPAISISFLVFGGGMSGSTDLSSFARGTVAVVSTLLVTAALLFRRFIPKTLALISCSSLFITLLFGIESMDLLAVMFALYTLAVYRSVRSAWIWALVGTVALAAGSVLSNPLNPASYVTSVMVGAPLLGVAAMLGITFGNRQRYVNALVERAAQLARERDQQAQLATASERARIAREMHDIVAHSLTVMIALADGASAIAAANPERAKHAMDNVGEIGRHSLADMRRVLGVLNNASNDQDGSHPAETGSTAASQAPMAPQPGFHDLKPLMESYRAAGLPLSYTFAGEAPEDQVVQLTIFRVAQEALTNALRYAKEPSRVDVLIDFRQRSVAIVRVIDDGQLPASGSPTGSVGSGRGLLGMRERVAVHNGTVEAGAITPRGWQVVATIPTG
jgi:signal transduction histidine kinase